MKYIILIFIAIILFACETKNSESLKIEDKLVIKFDSLKAKKLGADDYGMKQYIMAFLYRGDTIIQDSATKINLQKAHLENISKLAEEGELALAGPFLDNSDLRGIFIFNVNTIEEAEELCYSDPAIKAGVFKVELKPWYGSAAVMEVNKIHNSLSSKGLVD